ncbi:MAG: GHKL domain-containing protein [Thiomargarita sp.]|nr:GHKL domain-containing protein [Thiomargarita sp.]
MNKIFTNIVTVLSVILLIFLYQKTQLVDTEQHNQVISTLGTLKQLEAVWINQVLHSRLALNNNYDAMADTWITLETTHQRWQDFQLKRIYGENIAHAEYQKTAYLAQITKRREYIEQFKSVNAILSNSVRYFPTAVSELMRLEDTKLLVGDVNALLSAVLRYSLLPEKETQIQKLIDNLQEKGALSEQDIRSQINIIASHARTILKYRPYIDAILEQINILSTAQKIDLLTTTYVNLQDARLNESTPYHQMLMVFSGLLLLLILFIAYRLRVSYTALNRANQQLKTANDTLEQRVTERTRILSHTLEQLKDSQMQLVQSEKMASLGQMVAGLVHEINTPLGYVKSNIQLIQTIFSNLKHVLQEYRALIVNIPDHISNGKKLKTQIEEFDELKEDDSTGEELLKDALYGLKQIFELVINLKNFSRLDLSNISKVDLHEGLNSSLLIAKHLFKNKITINKQYGDIPKVKCAPSQINQVFLNLLTNAVQAIENKGSIIITTRVKNDHVLVLIQDNGKGIPKKVLPKIFDPFFTTKDIGEGTGMGLSISYKILQEHGGNIEVTSQEGKGTTFTVSLPTGI